MELQRQTNLKLVMTIEKLRRNTNEHLGGSAPFQYTSSPWGLRESRESSPLSEEEYLTAPIEESSASTAPIPIPPPGIAFLEEATPSPPVSQPPSPSRKHKVPFLPFGGVRAEAMARKRRARNAALRRSRGIGGSDSSHKESSVSSGQAGPSSLMPPPPDPRPKSSSPELEYLDPLPYTPFDNKCVHDIASWVKNGRPYLNRDVGVVPIDLSDDSIGRGRVGLGWSSEEIRQAEDHLAREDSEIDGLVLTHVKPPVRH
jgi:hypothetical protein